MFIRTPDGEYINTAHIVSFQVRRRKVGEKDSVTFELTGGGQAHAQYYDAIDLDQLLAHTVPATPGYEAVQLFVNPDGTEWTSRTPIIAWRIDGNYVTPVALDGPAHNGTGTGVLTPDGRVFVLEVADYPSFDAWVKGTKEAEVRYVATREVAG
jgi:hypothetical protein